MTDDLTNEKLLKAFKNQFDLVRYAIYLAEGEIKRGQESEGYGTQNIACSILDRLQAGSEAYIEEQEKLETTSE